eukprot:7393969-Pyramimonas_sp.AAC.1
MAADVGIALLGLGEARAAVSSTPRAIAQLGQIADVSAYSLLPATATHVASAPGSAARSIDPA